MGYKYDDLAILLSQKQPDHRAKGSEEYNKSLENLLVVFLEKENILSSLKDFHLQWFL